MVTLAILTITLSRAIPHLPNFSPLSAISLFGAAFYYKRYQAIVIPILFIWLSDLWVNNVIYSSYFDKFTWFYPGFYWQYLSYIFIALIGFFLLKVINLKAILFSSLSSSILFFLISNFGVWFSTEMYPKTTNGLLMCYIAGIPYLQGTLLGDLVYSLIFIGGFNIAYNKISAYILNH